MRHSPPMYVNIIRWCKTVNLELSAAIRQLFFKRSVAGLARRYGNPR